MKKLSIVLALLLVVAMAVPAVAEVEEITVGGSIQVRGQLQTPGVGTATVTIGSTPLQETLNLGDRGTILVVYAPGTLVPDPSNPQQVAAFLINLRNTQFAGWQVIPGQGGTLGTLVDLSIVPPQEITLSPRSFNDDFDNLDWWTQRTRVNVDAKLSGGVRAFVELQAYDFWGIDTNDTNEEAASFGNITPAPFGDEVSFGGIAGQGDSIVQLYQAYIEMNNVCDYPVQVRVGRQEIVEGREWLIGNNSAGVNFSGLAFDGIKGSYDTDLFKIDAWFAQLADFASPLVAPDQEADANVNFSGVYGTYKGIENMAIDAYLLWVRDPFDRGDAGVMNLYTVGARIAGAWDMGAPGMLDYNVEGAFQFGDSGSANGDGDSGDFGGWAVDAMLGYTFSNVMWTPRIEGEFAFFSGDDDLEDGDTDEFVRLFSDVHYGEFNLGGNLDANATNLMVGRLGVSIVPVEKLTVKADAYGFWLAETDGGGKTFGIPQLSVDDGLLVLGDDSDAGYELDLVGDYQYTEDLNLRAGWAVFIPGNAAENSWGAGNDDLINYLYVQAQLVF